MFSKKKHLHHQRDVKSADRFNWSDTHIQIFMEQSPQIHYFNISLTSHFSDVCDIYISFLFALNKIQKIYFDPRAFFRRATISNSMVN